MTTLTPEISDRITNYLAGADAATTSEIMDLQAAAATGDEEALGVLTESFGRDLDFGTGGLRGIMGHGTNRMNHTVVAKATQGLAQYVKSHNPKGSIAIAYDSRNRSAEFAREAARVAAGNGLKAYLFADLRPTPELSFAVRHLGATAGIVVTASHNPKEYSGYKVSWEDGGQVLPPHDRGIIEQVRSVQSMNQVELADFDQAVAEGSIVMLGEETDRAFFEALQLVRLRQPLTDSRGGELKIVYTPLHGTGIRVVPEALRQWGFTSVQIVPEQAEPNGDFPTTKSPNPEERVALELAIGLAEETKADIVLATDPDADRLGIAVRHDSDYQLITGNQLGALLAWYICETLHERGTLPENGAMVKTIVTTDLITAIADEYNVHLDNCLTGFKHIANLMRQYEEPNTVGEPTKQFLMGCEESYGYLVGTHCRDKDAVVAACVVSELALWAKTNGFTIVDILHQLYQRYGVHVESQVSQTMPGLAGMQDMENLMNRLREIPPREIAGIHVTEVTDIENDTRRHLASDETKPGPGLPKSNVLLFNLSDGSKIVARPSGTEPKIKYYFMVVDRENLPIEKNEVISDLARCHEKDKTLQKAWLQIVK